MVYKIVVWENIEHSTGEVDLETGEQDVGGPFSDPILELSEHMIIFALFQGAGDAIFH